MSTEKIKNIIHFYILTSTLKDKIRSGWKVWHIERERIESIAEHIYGTCMLAIAIDSEYDFEIDLMKVIKILVIHELEEIEIKDFTPFDKIATEEKRKIGKKAVEDVLKDLTKKEEIKELIEEFEDLKTKESIFARMCDKLESDIQCKIYCEEGCLNSNKDENKLLLQDERIQKLIETGSKTVSDFFVENHKNEILNQNKVFKEMADYIKNNTLLKE